MKNYLSIIGLVLLMAACNHSKTKQANSAEFKDSVFNYSDRFINIESITKAEYEKYPAVDYKKDYDVSNLLKAQHDTLKFVVDNTHSVVFTDTLLNSDSPDIRINKHIGNVLDYYIVESSYYESGDNTLVNKTNGLQYNLVSDPYLSPSKKYILSFGGSLEYMLPPTIQVWIVKPDRLIKKFEKDTSTPGFSIEDVRWISDEKLAVKIGFLVERTAYGVMTIK